MVKKTAAFRQRRAADTARRCEQLHRGAAVYPVEVDGHHTVFGHTALTKVKGLDQCHHEGASIIHFETLKNSGPFPIAFLRGVGLPDNLIDYLRSLLNTAIQHYSCFISYSSKDQAFAECLHADLQNKGVRRWFAPHDMPPGAARFLYARRRAA